MNENEVVKAGNLVGSEGSEAELLGALGKTTPLLPAEVTEVQATCARVEGPRYYYEFKQTKLAFVFRVVEPSEFEGVELTKYVRKEPKWNQPPLRSELLRMFRLLQPNGNARRRITKQMFVNKLYLLEVGPVIRDGVLVYTTVKKVLEILAG